MANTKFLDLGHIFYNIYLDSSPSPTPLIREQTYFGDLEDRIAASGLNDGVNFSASPFGYWNGSPTNSKGYGIEMRHLVGGSPTGKDFYLFMSGAGSGGGGAQAEPNEAFDGTVGNYFSVNNAGIDSFVGIYYNPFGLTNPVQWGVASRFDPPTVNPRTDTAGFFNQPAAGVHRSRFHQFVDAYPYNWGLVYNADIPFVGFYFGYGMTGHLYGFDYSGDIMIPRDAGDPYINGHISIFVNPTESNSDADFVNVFSVDDAGAKVNYSIDTHENFTRFNSPRSDGSYNADAIKVTSSTHDKGVIDPQVMAIQGPTDFEHHRLYAGPQGPRLKMEAVLAAVVPDDIALPFLGYPGVLNPGSDL